MPEHGIGVLPLWDRSPGGGGALEADDVGISVQLAARLREWNTRWAAHSPEKQRSWSPQEQNDWLQTGYRLARQLQFELPDVEVLIADNRGREVAISETQ